MDTNDKTLSVNEKFFVRAVQRVYGMSLRIVIPEQMKDEALKQFKFDLDALFLELQELYREQITEELALEFDIDKERFGFLGMQ